MCCENNAQVAKGGGALIWKSDYMSTCMSVSNIRNILETWSEWSGKINSNMRGYKVTGDWVRVRLEHNLSCFLPKQEIYHFNLQFFSAYIYYLCSTNILKIHRMAITWTVLKTTSLLYVLPYFFVIVFCGNCASRQSKDHQVDNWPCSGNDPGACWGQGWRRAKDRAGEENTSDSPVLI